MRDDSRLEPSSFAAVACVFYGIMAVVAAAVVGVRGGRAALVPPSSVVVAWAVVGGALVGVGVALASRPLSRLPSWRPLFDGVRRIIGPQTPGTCLVLALTSGVAEEALFRGALQPWLGLWSAALLFAVAHAPQVILPSEDELARSLRRWPAFAFVVGLLFGYLARGMGTWLAAAAAHAIVNYLNLRYVCGSEAHDAGASAEDPPGVP